MEAVYVFLRRNSLNNLVIINVLWHGQLHQNTVDRIVIVQGINELQQLFLSGFLRQLIGLRLNADICTCLFLVAYIYGRCRVITYLNHRQTDGNALLLICSHFCL